LAFQACRFLSGDVKVLEKEDRDWNAMEIKGVGLGEPCHEARAICIPLGRTLDLQLNFWIIQKG
jgi:hypothetical protein